MAAPWKQTISSWPCRLAVSTEYDLLLNFLLKEDSSIKDQLEELF